MIEQDPQEEEGLHANKEESSGDEAVEEDEEDKFLMSSVEEDALMNRFTTWLKSEDGGKKCERIAKDHARVTMLAARYNVDKPNFHNLLNRKHLNLWMTELDDRKIQPGTIRTYLASISLFHKLILINEEKAFDKEKTRDIEPVLRQWRNTLFRHARELQHGKDIKVQERFPCPADFIEFDDCENVKEAIDLLKRMNEGSIDISRNAFSRARDYLITCLINDNTSRPGAVSNMTLEEFSLADKQTQGWVISVMKHKTSVQGPANLAMNFNTYGYLRMYIKIRNKLPGVGKNPDDKVFISWACNAISSNMVSTAFSKFW